MGDTEPRFVMDLCRYLSEYADILVLAPHARGAARTETLDGISVRRFRYFIPAWQALTYQGGIAARMRENSWRALQIPFFFIAFWWTTRRLIRLWKPDVIHAHWIVPQALVACLSARGRVPIFCTSHGGDLYGLRAPLFQQLKSCILRRCHHLTVVSQSMLEPARLLAPSIPIDVIPMGTDLSTLFTPPVDPLVREGGEIIFVGRLVEKKGLQYLIEAFATLQSDFPDLKLTIVGDGPLKEAIRNLVLNRRMEDRVTFLGNVRHDVLPTVLQRAVLAVFPFVIASDGDQEGFGLVIVEAMGCGCPVIASDIPAVHESIRPGVTGVLVRPGDPVALAHAIRQCLSDPALRSSLAASALISVRSRFNWPVIAKQYARALVACLHS